MYYKTISLSIIIADSVGLVPSAHTVKINQIKLWLLQCRRACRNKPIHVSTGEIFSAEDIWQHHLALKRPLNSPKPTPEQHNWVIGLTKSASEPTRANPDHPNQRKAVKHWLIGFPQFTVID